MNGSLGMFRYFEYVIDSRCQMLLSDSLDLLQREGENTGKN